MAPPVPVALPGDELLRFQDLERVEQLEQEELDVHLTQVDEIARGVEEVHLPSALDLPVAPKSKVKAQLTDEERELAELEASMMG